MPKIKKLIETMLSDLNSNIIKETYAQSIITSLHGWLEKNLQHYKDKIERYKVQQEEIKNKLQSGLYESRYDLGIEISEIKDNYKESKYYTEDKSKLKKIFDETLTGKNPTLDNYYQREISKYYIQFRDIIKNYPANIISKNIIPLDKLGILFEISGQTFWLLPAHIFGNTFGRYNETDRIIYLFLLEGKENITENDKKICLSEIAKSIFFHEMTHKLDSDVIKGDNENNSLSLTKKDKKNLALGKKPDQKKKKNSDGEFNATLAMFIEYIQRIIDTNNIQIDLDDPEKTHQTINILFNAIIAGNTKILTNNIDLLSIAYSELNETNKNRLINSIQDYFTTKFF